jgi:hypothetical protein
VTLILTVNGRETIWLFADRRLSYERQKPKDDARKILCLDTDDGVAILGYAGLGATTPIEADQAMVASFLDKALRSRNVATGPINPIKKAAFVPNPVRGCRPRLERYENISRSSVIVSGQA